MKWQIVYILSVFLTISIQVNAQTDSILSKLTLELDYRFRIEQDWDSKKSNGSCRDDRTRLRYRLRTGATFQHDWCSLGFRIRTGQQNKQQDPQLTLGKGLEEFGTLPIGFEKIYFKGSHKTWTYWVGKNGFSFSKNNELFWSDNVFPEGVFIEHKFKINLKTIEAIQLKASHYILSSNGAGLLQDAYLQGIQSTINSRNKRLVLFPSIYLMRNIPNIPDGNSTFDMNYSIFHLGAKLKLLKSELLILDADFYHNFEDYSDFEPISTAFKKETTGYSFGVQVGRFAEAKDWKFKLTYTLLQRYAALDYMAQNDWARWDYSAFDSPDGRLTNLQGIELVAGYNISKTINIIAKYYTVKQLIPTGLSQETGQRIRLDLNVSI